MQNFFDVLHMTIIETIVFQKLIGVAQSNKFEVKRLIQREIQWFETNVMGVLDSDDEGKEFVC